MARQIAPIFPLSLSVLLLLCPIASHSSVSFPFPSPRPSSHSVWHFHIPAQDFVLFLYAKSAINGLTTAKWETVFYLSCPSPGLGEGDGGAWMLRWTDPMLKSFCFTLICNRGAVWLVKHTILHNWGNEMSRVRASGPNRQRLDSWITVVVCFGRAELSQAFIFLAQKMEASLHMK